MTRAILPVLTMSLVLSAGGAAPATPTSDFEGLHELIRERGIFKKTLIRPDADFARYRQFSQARVRLQFRNPARSGSDAAATGSIIKKRSKPSTIPDREDRTRFGQIVAKAFAQEGANVILVSRTQSALDEAAAEVTQLANVKVETLAADLSKIEERERVFATHPDVDILVKPGHAITHV